ncbi:MAG TPA: hypothetical protein VK752_31420 [Bryobacteraceae bacterium]|jgi:hypothetical protein|nr:hypothetical protein [Bryobacteraceae bacterium]
MKWFCLFAALSVANAGSEVRPELMDVKTVYLLPMSYSLDQFLAIRLTKGAILQVVTDPNLADAILSEHIGSGLEDQLKSLYGEKKAVEGGDKDKDKDKSTAFGSPMAGGTRSKGAVFLVDRKTRSVIWSDYVRPKSAQPDELNHVADKIAGQLEKDKKGKKDK